MGSQSRTRLSDWSDLIHKNSMIENKLSKGNDGGSVPIMFSSAWKWKVKVKSLSSVRLLAAPWTVCSLPGSSFHGISQAKVLEWGAIAFSIMLLNTTLNYFEHHCRRCINRNEPPLSGLWCSRCKSDLNEVSFYSHRVGHIQMFSEHHVNWCRGSIPSGYRDVVSGLFHL